MISTRLISVADLDSYPEDDWNRYELIEGELHVSEPPSIPHQFVLQNLQFELLRYLRKNPIGKMVPGAGAVFSIFDAVIPDLMYASHERWKEVTDGTRFVAAPDLVIEIVSPGRENRRRDIDLKRGLYGRYGVREYWIVDPEDQSVALYELQGASLELTRTFKDNAEIQSALFPGLSLTASTIFQL